MARMGATTLALLQLQPACLFAMKYKMMKDIQHNNQTFSLVTVHVIGKGRANPLSWGVLAQVSMHSSGDCDHCQMDIFSFSDAALSPNQQFIVWII